MGKKVRVRKPQVAPLPAESAAAAALQAVITGLKQENAQLQVALITARALTPPPASTSNRRRLPPRRDAITHKFEIDGHEGYVTVGLFEDGSPGEVFIRVARTGSTVRGLVDAIGALVSIALQSGVPLETLVKKFEYCRFEPAGFTKNPSIPIAQSIIDYLFRWMGQRWVKDYTVNVPLPLEQLPPSER